MALPMLLYSSDVKAWVSESRMTLFAFGLCLISGLIGAGIGGYVFQSYISESWIPAGMMVGISSGGTPNLFAVGIALEAKDEVFTLTNSSQIFWGAIYLIFLLSLSARVFGWFLKIPKPTAFESEEISSYLQYDKVSLKDSLIAILITIGIVAFSVGISFAVFGKLEPTIIIVFITSLGIISSLSPAIRKLRGPFEIGDYLLLMFGISVGMVSDFHILLSEGGPYILFVFLIMFLTVSIHMVLCKLFKIDRDTFIITSTAGIYGPVFISQIAYALKNKSLIVGGMAVSLLGLAIGNYLGIGLAYFLKWVL